MKRRACWEKDSAAEKKRKQRDWLASYDRPTTEDRAISQLEVCRGNEYEAPTFLKWLPTHVMRHILAPYVAHLYTCFDVRFSTLDDPVLTLERLQFARLLPAAVFFRTLGWSKNSFDSFCHTGRWAESCDYFVDTLGRACLVYDAYTTERSPHNTLISQSFHHCPNGPRATVLVEQYTTPDTNVQPHGWISIPGPRGSHGIECHRPNIWIFRLVPK